MPDLTPVRLPKETVSDDSYLLSELPLASGAKVRRDELIAVFQTSKAALELVAPADGYLHHRLAKGQQVAVGALVAVVSSSPEFPEAAFAAPSVASPAPAPAAAAGEGRLSKPAQELIAKHALDPSLFRHLDVVKRSDVEAYLALGATKAAATPTISVNGPSILILGGGGHAKMCIDILRQMGGYRIAGIVDAQLGTGSRVLDIPVIGKDADLPRLRSQGMELAVNGIGAASAHQKRGAFYRLLKEAGFKLPNLVHPSAAVEPSVRLGEGNQLMANATVGSATIIHNNCIVNSAAVVSHDSVLADNVHVAPGAILAGTVGVGEDTLIGMGATVYFGVKVGARVVVNNGVNVFKDIADGAVVRE